MNGDTIYHLHIKRTDEHRYFGSISAIFDVFTPINLGVNLRKLYGHKLSKAHPYENEKCIIRQGAIVRKSQKPRAKFDPFN